jgi:hypothetical protein
MGEKLFSISHSTVDPAKIEKLKAKVAELEKLATEDT